QYGISLRQWRFAESCELGLARRDDARLRGALWELYEHSPVAHRDTGLSPAPVKSALLDSQGIAVLRRDAGRVYAALDYGHSGGGHGHPDRLNLLIAVGADRWLDDAGTGSYVDPTLFWY